MTDNEIVKALECCKGDIADCHNCPYDEICGNHDNKMLIDTLNLINRQKAEIETANAEIERLKTEKEHYAELEQGCYVTGVKNIKAETYKECIEKVKEKSKKTEILCSGALITTSYLISAKNFNNLLKELVGEDDESAD